MNTALTPISNNVEVLPDLPNSNSLLSTQTQVPVLDPSTGIRDSNPAVPVDSAASTNSSNDMKYTEGAVLTELPMSRDPSLSSGNCTTCDRSLQCVQSALSSVSSGHELSISLPNLTAAFDTVMLNRINRKQERNSLSDICSSGVMPDGHRNPADLPNARQLQIKTLSLEDCVSCGQDEGQGQGKAHCGRCSKVIAGLPPSQDPAQDLSVSVAPHNSHLAAVLENIPLLYLPHTKQLITVNSNSTEPGLNCKLDKDATALLPPPSSSNSSETNKDFTPNHQDQQNTVITNSANPRGLSLQLEPSQVSGNTTPNYDSAPEAHSSDIVEPSPKSQVNSSSNQSHEDVDEDSINETTRISIDRESDSPRSTLDRVSTAESLTRTDASSFSSISSLSTGTDFSTSVVSYPEEPVEGRSPAASGTTVNPETDEGGFVEVNLTSKNSFERTRDGSQDSGIDERLNLPPAHQCVKNKRKGITSFLSRNLFWRKAKETSTDSSAPGWKLFGKVPPKHSPTPRDPDEISQDFKARTHSLSLLPGADLLDSVDPLGQQFCRSKKVDVEVASTTALILEQRPRGLPSKDPEEELRHKQQYEAMIEGAKKKEQKEAKQRKRQLQQQLKHEEAMSTAVKVWNTEILVNWDTMKSGKKARDLWWSGIPPAVRGKVWKLAFGNDLNLTPELYDICLNRARERLKLMREQCAGSDTDSVSSFSSFTLTEPSSSKESSVELIKLDVSRTFPQLCIFQKGGPYHDLLQGLLGAYVCYRPDIGYVQGMSFIAAVLLLNMDIADAFICFANLLNRPCQIAFFRLDESLIKSYFETYEEFFEENLPKLFAHFKKQSLTPDLYIIDWMFTLYAKSLPLDVASRVWDVFCRDGEEFLFRTALGILKLYEEVLLNMDFIHLAQFLTRLPENISGEDIFQCIDCIHMNIDKNRFQQVLASHREVKDT